MPHAYVVSTHTYTRTCPHTLKCTYVRTVEYNRSYFACARAYTRPYAPPLTFSHWACPASWPCDPPTCHRKRASLTSVRDTIVHAPSVAPHRATAPKPRATLPCRNSGGTALDDSRSSAARNGGAPLDSALGTAQVRGFPQAPQKATLITVSIVEGMLIDPLYMTSHKQQHAALQFDTSIVEATTANKAGRTETRSRTALSSCVHSRHRPL